MHLTLGEGGADTAIQKRFDVTQQKDEVETQAGDSGRGRSGKHAYRPLGAEREARVGAVCLFSWLSDLGHLLMAVRRAYCVATPNPYSNNHNHILSYG